MNELELCREIFDDDVVRVDLIPANGSSLPVPFNVPGVSQMHGLYPNPTVIPSNWADFADALLTMAINNGGDVDALVKSGSQHKVTTSREAAGITRTHTAQINILQGFQNVRNKAKQLQGIDFHILLTTYDGTQYLAYALPNTCQFAIEEAAGEGGSLTVKATLKSYSSLIRLILD